MPRFDTPGFDDKVPTWEATGEIGVQPTASCETDEVEQVDESVEAADNEA